MRIVFRLVEFSAGVGESNPLPYHEIYPLVLDASPMLLAMTILSIIHPGMVLKGPQSEFPSRKEKKQMKMDKKQAKKDMKAAKKSGKSFGYGEGPEYSPLNDSRGDIELEVPHENRFYRDGNASVDHSRDNSRDYLGNRPQQYPEQSV